MTQTIEVRVPAVLAFRDLAIRAVSTACKQSVAVRALGNDAAQEFTHQVVSAVGEAFNNIAVHGYRELPTGSVEIKISTGADRVEVRMFDRGRSFDPDAVPAPDLADLPETGMGLFIIRSFMDLVRYRPGEPNELLMAKYIPH